MKENIKTNKKRIIFWSIIMIICISVAIYGKSSYNNGFGKYGSVKRILDPIAVEFNTSDNVKKLTDIRAEVSKGKLVVTYINASNKKEKYVYEYINNNGIEYITNTDEYNSNTWSFIAFEMINAVYHLNGGKGSVFELYDIKSFETTTLLDGLVYNSNSKVISINIKTNLVKNVYGKIESLKDNIYAKEEDLTNLKAELETLNTFNFKKEDINLYVRNSDKTYDIYIALTEENTKRAFKSIGNVIKILKPDIYDAIADENGDIEFTQTSTYYETQPNVTFSEANIFDVNDAVFEVKINK